MQLNVPQTSVASLLHPRPNKTTIRFNGAMLERQKALQEKIRLENEQKLVETRKALTSSTKPIFTLNGDPLSPMAFLRLIEEVHQVEREKPKPHKRLWKGLTTASGISGALIGLGLIPLHPCPIILSGIGLFLGICNSREASGKVSTVSLFKVAELSENARNCEIELDSVAENMRKALFPMVSAGFLDMEGYSVKLTPLGHEALQAPQFQPEQVENPLEAKARHILEQVQNNPQSLAPENLREASLSDLSTLPNSHKASGQSGGS